MGRPLQLPFRFNMSGLIFFVVLGLAHGEDRRVQYVPNDDEVEGIVQLTDLVNFVRPVFYRNDKFVQGGSGYSRTSHLEPFDTRRSDKPENHEPSAHEQIIQITQEIPVPYPVRIEKKVHFPVPIPVEQPVPVHVPQPYPVRVEKKVPVPVAIPVAKPFPVHRTVPVPVEVAVDNPVPYVVYKPVPFYIQKNVPQPIIRHVPIQVEVPVSVNKEVQVPVQVEKKVPLYVPKPVPIEVKVPIEKMYKVEIPVPYPVAVENQMTSNNDVQLTMTQMINGAKYLFEKSVQLPVDVSGGRFRNSHQDG